jgi:trk system potassium uptake protein TrkH
MNFKLIAKLLSIIALAISCAFSLSLTVGIFYLDFPGETHAITGFLLSIVFSLSLCLALMRLSRGSTQKMFRREALIVIGFGWILASLLGALPYWLIIPTCGFVDAIFESASGLTTTGATILHDIETLPRSLLFWRSISQWIGGLGVVMFFVAILSFIGAGAKILFSRESSAQAADLQSARIQTGIRRLMGIYMGLSAICTLTFYVCGMNFYDALNHMFTTLSTGGFSTRAMSIAAFKSPLIEWMVILFMCLGGTSFLILIRCCRGDWRALMNASEVKFYYGIILASTLIISLLVFADQNMGVHDTVRHSLFQVVSIMTTTGFGTVDFDLWLPSTHIILLMLMIVGGCSGSTGGGIKVVRAQVGLKIFQRAVIRAYRPRIVQPIHINHQCLEEDDINNISTFLVMMGFVCIGSILILSILEPTMSFKGLISALFACIFNIGPGFNEVGPLCDYSGLSSITKLFLSLIMIAGRLELYAILALLTPSMWHRYH